MSRDVLVKQSVMEGGIGSMEASPLWESDPTDEGAIVRLDQTIDNRYFLTFTDAEEFDGAYVSVEVTPHDLDTLFVKLRDGAGMRPRAGSDEPRQDGPICGDRSGSW